MHNNVATIKDKSNKIYTLSFVKRENNISFLGEDFCIRAECALYEGSPNPIKVARAKVIPVLIIELIERNEIDKQTFEDFVRLLKIVFAINPPSKFTQNTRYNSLVFRREGYYCGAANIFQKPYRSNVDVLFLCKTDSYFAPNFLKLKSDNFDIFWFKAHQIINSMYIKKVDTLKHKPIKSNLLTINAAGEYIGINIIAWTNIITNVVAERASIESINLFTFFEFCLISLSQITSKLAYLKFGKDKDKTDKLLTRVDDTALMFFADVLRAIGARESEIKALVSEFLTNYNIQADRMENLRLLPDNNKSYKNTYIWEACKHCVKMSIDGYNLKEHAGYNLECLMCMLTCVNDGNLYELLELKPTFTDIPVLEEKVYSALIDFHSIGDN